MEREYLIKYPAASDFLEWLLPKLNKLGIPYENRETGGDYYSVRIGGKKAPVRQLNWKHLDQLEIDTFSADLLPYGWEIKTAPHPTDPFSYRVAMRAVRSTDKRKTVGGSKKKTPRRKSPKNRKKSPRR